MKHAAVFFVVLAGLVATGCGERSVAPMTPAHQSSTAMVAIGNDDVPDTATAQVGIRLTGESSTTNKKYGFILGYFFGKTSTMSQVISVEHGENIRFFNVDTSRPHTASFLGDATATKAPWPSSFDGSATQSPAGTAIGTTNFSTGILNPGGKSLLYSTGAPGFYMFGCAIHYNSNMMRTVVIVH